MSSPGQRTTTPPHGSTPIVMGRHRATALAVVSCGSTARVSGRSAVFTQAQPNGRDHSAQSVPIGQDLPHPARIPRGSLRAQSRRIFSRAVRAAWPAQKLMLVERPIVLVGVGASRALTAGATRRFLERSREGPVASGQSRPWSWAASFPKCSRADARYSPASSSCGGTSEAIRSSARDAGSAPLLTLLARYFG